MNQAIHTIDLLSYLGGRISSLRAMEGSLLELGVDVEDSAIARLTYENGARGLFVATLANYRDEFLQIAVETEREEFVIEQEALWSRKPDGSRELLARDERLTGGKAYYGSGHFKLISRFYRAIEEDGSDYVHIADAVQSIRMVDAIRRSSRTGEAVRL